MGHTESWASFGRRVKALVGFSLGEIPEGEIADLQRGKKVICRRGPWFIVRVADPVIQRENDLEGGHTFEPFDEADHFRLVKLDN